MCFLTRGVKSASLSVFGYLLLQLFLKVFLSFRLSVSTLLPLNPSHSLSPSLCLTLAVSPAHVQGSSPCSIDEMMHAVSFKVICVAWCFFFYARGLNCRMYMCVLHRTHRGNETLPVCSLCYLNLFSAALQ